MNSILENVRTDDFVEYFVYPSTECLCSSDKLSELHSRVTHFVSPWIENYFWHRDKFNLNKVDDNTQSECDGPHLHGVVHYGENIDDEWFVVYLMKKISENFDVIIRVIDSDGEFLLIEAADYLSKWMNPDSCDRRVYFHKGTVKVVPIDILPKIAKIEPIVSYLNTSHRATEVEKNIMKCIDVKLQKYSDNPEQLLHRSRVRLPAKVAALLNAKPTLISMAISAFCDRDVIDTKVCRKMKYFPPEDLVLRSVKFTKFSYAMISQDKSKPERNRWILPSPSDAHYKEYLLGYQITSGFEILASKCTKKSESDLTLSKKWSQYVQVLKKKGYFKDLLEHSKEYVELENKARMYFLDNVGVEETSYDNILSILQTVNFNVVEMKREEADVPASDDEKWMEITEDQFNKLLEERFDLKGVDATSSPNVLSSAINKFLNQMSDVEGIEIENHEFSSQKDEMDVEAETNHVSFEADNFMASVQQMLAALNGASLENANEDSDDDDDDYDSDDDNSAEEDPEMKSYMDLMDKEVAKSTLAKSFPSDESLQPVHIDMDAMANILKSYEEQCGGSGPAGNLLHSMGLKIDIEKKT